MELILASQSPRRRELLGGLGLPFRVLAPEIDERMDRSLSPDQLVERISLEKAQAPQVTAAISSSSPLLRKKSFKPRHSPLRI